MDKNKTIPTLSETTVMPCAISDDDLKSAYEKIQIDFEPIQAEFDIIKSKFESDKKERNDTFKIILEKYYDERFLDKEGTPIKIGDTISDGKSFYYVSDRGMQMIFGTMIFNNRITCKKLDKDLRIGKKDFSFFPRDLTDFVVHKA
ncbi:hypothetical protein LVDJXP189_2210010 [Flavobacterium psychrophilum]|uniref:Uncharacterized protein n=3 Tax=Unahavirus TaxID=2560245 RepID=A0A1B0WMC7_9CAUD|nr:hypothetical protein [Flavobacterium psychrophilum]YP_008320467.1 hypothetical protein N375_gp53 [Flavobacterium phage 6H]YP_009321862.1 hypothetical protein BOX11_gp41 [Flavobacterium phage 1H]YP_009592355.1 hypothetical protein FDG69_gp47 [Flavobacterium phage 23T]AGN89436.1 hypothetical protein [Flavobacterium phage 6H]ANB41019.1 hypothetical protein [Flavobacterium phage 23T]ANB41070.1 hypothetical protein [Flavobacterium phage 1H]SNA75592.1 hypothetical protein of prophage 6H [Flavob